MIRSDEPPGKSVFPALALLGQLGFTVAVPIVVSVLAGQYLDRRLGTHGLVLAAMILLGIAGGVYGAYRLLAKDIRWKP